MKISFSIIFIFTFFCALNAQGMFIKSPISNVMYRNVENQISIQTNPNDSLGPVSLTSSVSGLRSGGASGKFFTIPTSENQSIRFTVSAKNNKGKVKSNTADYELINIPPVSSYIQFKSFLKLDKTEFKNVKVEAAIPDFVYPISFEVESFELKIPNQKPILIKGNVFPEDVLNKLNKVKVGEHITLQNITCLATEGYFAEDKNFISYNPIVIEIK